MGVIADAIVAYAQPLLDGTDGSEEQLNKAFTISQLCFNLALMSEDERVRLLSETRKSFKMDEEEFDDLRRSIIVPMIQRHQEMFPLMHGRETTNFPPTGPSPVGPSPGDASPSGPSWRARLSTAARREAYPGTNRYAPCPCNSGRKYKFCCGKKRR